MRNKKPLQVIRKKRKRVIVTDRYHTKVLRKLGQIGKQVHAKNPIIKAVVMKFLNLLFPSKIQV